MADTADGDRWTVRDVPPEARKAANDGARRRDEKLGVWVARALLAQAKREESDGIFPPGALVYEPSAEPPPHLHQNAPLLLTGPADGVADARERAGLALEVLRADGLDEATRKLATALLQGALRQAKPPRRKLVPGGVATGTHRAPV